MTDESNDPPDNRPPKPRELSQTPAAVRARNYRLRKKARKSGIFVPFDQLETGQVADFLVDQRKLPEWDAENAEAIGRAVAAFLKDAMLRA